MITKFNPLFKVIAEEIEKLIHHSYPEVTLSLEEIAALLSKAPNIAMGHYAFACFQLSKSLKKAPALVAAELSKTQHQSDLIEEFKAVGPYLNLFIRSEAFGKYVLTPIKSGESFTSSLVDQKEKIMVEYSQPNTHKELHVGHMRNICLGNAVIRMLRYAGMDVLATTYPGDVGTHVAKCLWYLKFHHKGELPKEQRGAFLGSIYTKATLKLEDEAETPENELNKAELTKILRELEEKKGDYYALWQQTREWSIDLFKEAYHWTDVTFDHWYFESEVDSSSLMMVKKLYEDGKLVLSDGAVGMDLSEENLGFCLLIKKDGNGLYATKDIALAYKKFEDYKIDRNIYVVDKRQAFHFQQVFATLKKLGFARAEACFHLAYDFVELPNGAMSSRKGNIIPLMDLVSSMEETIKTNYLAKYRGEWSEEEINQTARIVANGAIKYGMLRMDNNRKIVFDLSEWLKLEGETGPYLQYVYARINSLCTKQNFKESESANYSLLKDKREIELISHLSWFNNVVKEAALQYKTAPLCGYLYDLAKLYNAFYAECPVARAENRELSLARVHLSYTVGRVMKEGLALLGIPSPSRM